MTAILQPFGLQLVAGVTWDWTVTLSDYSAADGWTLKYFFRGNGNKLDVVSTASGSDFKLNVSAANTGKLKAGRVSWEAVVVDLLGNRNLVGSGSVEFVQDLEAAGENFDGRTQDERIYDFVCANLEGTASREAAEYQIDGRMLRAWDPAKLEELKSIYAGRIRQAKIASGQLGSNAGQFNVRFC